MYGRRLATSRTSSNRSSSIAVGFHCPLMNASRSAGGRLASMRSAPAVMTPVSTSASIESLGSALDERLQRVDRRVICRRSRGSRAWRSCPGRSRRTTRRRSRESRGAPAPAARARATIRSRNCRSRRAPSRPGIAASLNGCCRIGRAVVLEQVVLEPLERSPRAETAPA